MSGWDQHHDQEPREPIPRTLIVMTVGLAVFVAAWILWPVLT